MVSGAGADTVSRQVPRVAEMIEKDIMSLLM